MGYKVVARGGGRAVSCNTARLGTRTNNNNTLDLKRRVNYESMLA